MDRATLLGQLALALRNVTQGELHIAQQRENIATLDGLGLDTSAAKAALLLFEELQGMHVADRERLQKELAEKYPQIPTYLYQLDLLSFWPPEEK